MGEQTHIMRVLLTVCTIALLAGAFAVTEEDSFVEAQQSIQDMKKKGATEADCKDLAKTTCKEVLGEVRKDQKVIDSQSSGIHCNKLGGGAVTVAIRHYHKRVTQWKVAKKKIVTASSTKVTIASQSYKSLRSGKCGWVFSSWPGWQTSWDAHFNINCGHQPAIGFSSAHNNGRE